MRGVYERGGYTMHRGSQVRSIFSPSRTSATTSWTFSHARIFIGMPAMSGCVALTSIDLGYNKLTAEGLDPFCSNPPPNLTKLEMRSCGLQGTYLGQPVLLLVGPSLMLVFS